MYFSERGNGDQNVHQRWHFMQRAARSLRAWLSDRQELKPQFCHFLAMGHRSITTTNDGGQKVLLRMQDAHIQNRALGSVQASDTVPRGITTALVYPLPPPFLFIWFFFLNSSWNTRTHTDLSTLTNLHSNACWDQYYPVALYFLIVSTDGILVNRFHSNLSAFNNLWSS